MGSWYKIEEQQGATITEKVQAAFDAAGVDTSERPTVWGDSAEYELTDQINLQGLGDIAVEGCRFKMADEVSSTLSVSITAPTSVITVADAAAFEVGRLIMICDSPDTQDSATFDGPSFSAQITNKNGNQLTLNKNVTSTHPIGASVVVTYDVFYVDTSPAQTQVWWRNCTIDMNKTGNPSTFDWRHKRFFSADGGAHLFTECTFLDTPSECIIGGKGVIILNCFYKGLNGSLYHGSDSAGTEFIHARSVLPVQGVGIGQGFCLESTKVFHGINLFEVSVGVEEVLLDGVQAVGGGQGSNEAGLMGPFNSDDGQVSIINCVVKLCTGPDAVTLGGGVVPDIEITHSRFEGDDTHECNVSLGTGTSTVERAKLIGLTVINGRVDVDAERAAIVNACIVERTPTFGGFGDAIAALNVDGDKVSVTGNQVHGGHHDGTAQGGSANTITLAASASATDDEYNTLPVEIIGGTGAGQSGDITDYDGTTKVATISGTFSPAPDATSVYVVGAYKLSATNLIDANNQTFQAA